jgi:uncharacterized repeat protein (TIGR03803 family)
MKKTVIKRFWLGLFCSKFRHCLSAVLFSIGAGLIGDPSATAQSITPIYSFTNGPAYPVAGLALGSDLNFYGTTSGGGSSGNGTVFVVTTNGAWFTLVGFDGVDGANPQAALTLGPDGNFYGTTFNGGTGGQGTVFCMGTNGTLTTLANFATTNGANPQASLTLSTNGVFYGTTSQGGAYNNGTIFAITTNGVLSTLVNFDGTNGATPEAGLTAGAGGVFYGTTYSGGSNGDGTLFKVTTNGTLSMLASFNDTNGANPCANLAWGTDGLLYGTTYGGGGSGLGTVFKVTTNGALTTLSSLSGSIGGNPQAGLAHGRRMPPQALPFLPAIPPVQHMVDRPGVCTSQRSRHGLECADYFRHCQPVERVRTDTCMAVYPTGIGPTSPAFWTLACRPLRDTLHGVKRLRFYDCFETTKAWLCSDRDSSRCSDNLLLSCYHPQFCGWRTSSGQRPGLCGGVARGSYRYEPTLHNPHPPLWNKWPNSIAMANTKATEVAKMSL